MGCDFRFGVTFHDFRTGFTRLPFTCLYPRVRTRTHVALPLRTCPRHTPPAHTTTTSFIRILPFTHLYLHTHYTFYHTCTTLPVASTFVCRRYVAYSTRLARRIYALPHAAHAFHTRLRTHTCILIWVCYVCTFHVPSPVLRVYYTFGYPRDFTSLFDVDHIHDFALSRFFPLFDTAFTGVTLPTDSTRCLRYDLPSLTFALLFIYVEGLFPAHGDSPRAMGYLHVYRTLTVPRLRVHHYIYLFVRSVPFPHTTV